jgi:hypothetical protein
MRGEIYMLNKEQLYSEKIGKVCTINVLNRLTPIEEYNATHIKKKNEDKYDFVKEKIISSFKEIDILLELVRIYKEVGVK